MSEQTYIGTLPADVARDGRWDCMCARCGSTIAHEPCEHCGGEGLDGHDCGEDSCCCADPEPNVTCDECLGACGFWRCLSDDKSEWCRRNPLPGREHIEPSTPEWFRLSEWAEDTKP